MIRVILNLFRRTPMPETTQTDPLDHPAIRHMSPAELADLPWPRRHKPRTRS